MTAMDCPYCKTKIEPNTPECPACRVTFPRASALLGAVPRLTTGISDEGNLMTPDEIGKLRSAIRTLKSKFPQLMVQVVLHAFPAEHPFGLHAFWLFNAASFSGDTNRGANNHTVMLVVDPQRQESSVVLGYGLEGQVGDEVLDHLQELAGPAWKAGRWADGLLTLLDGLDRLFESIAHVHEFDHASGEF
jgi:uncharacterized membrane protein YgcG